MQTSTWAVVGAGGAAVVLGGGATAVVVGAMRGAGEVRAAVVGAVEEAGDVGATCGVVDVGTAAAEVVDGAVGALVLCETFAGAGAAAGPEAVD